MKHQTKLCELLTFATSFLSHFDMSKKLKNYLLVVFLFCSERTHLLSHMTIAEEQLTQSNDFESMNNSLDLNNPPAFDEQEEKVSDLLIEVCIINKMILFKVC